MQHILVDYLTLSVSMNVFNLDYIFNSIGIKQEEFTELKSRLGLHKCLYYGGIKIHYHDIDEEIEKPLIVIDMSGKGCRLLETVHQNEKFNWIDFIEIFLSTEGSHLARLDIACDDKVECDEKPILSFPLMVRHLKERKYICQANRKIYTDGDEQNIVFGAPSSDRRLRIYNKALERGYDKHWIRAEFQLRNEAALSFYMRALERADIGQAYYGMLYAYLRFTREVNDVDNKNQNRLTVTRWWKSFCHGAEKIKGFYLGGCDYNMDSLQGFLRKQVSSSVQTFMQIKDGDLGSLLGLFDGAKLNKQQEWLVKVERLKAEIEKDYGEQEQLLHEIQADGYEII